MNYILALGDLLQKRRGKINIPIYLANAVKLPVAKELDWVERPIPTYEVEIDGNKIEIPDTLLENPMEYDDALNLVNDFARRNIRREINKSQFYSYLINQGSKLGEDENIARLLFELAKVLKEFMELDKDSIWKFVLKNIYKPLFLRKKFDYLVGNPPWLAFRYAEQEYQKFLKKEIVENYKILKGRGELITHLELGTYFFVRSLDLYLKDGGKIAFVLPRSIFTADQHDGFRRIHSIKANLFYTELWDLEEVSPLFNVPAAVLIAQKKRKPGSFQPIPGERVSGNLDKKNTSFAEATERLKIEKVKWHLHIIGGGRSYWAAKEKRGEIRESYYKKYFSQGATIVPRCFWFVEIRSLGLGFDLNSPPLESSEKALKEAKGVYKGLVFEGRVESQFLYATLLSGDILPFGHLDYRLVVLPIKPEGDHYRMITSEEARQKGLIYLAQWLEKAEEEWEKRRGKKSEEMSIYERLNYYETLMQQNPKARYRVIYPSLQRIMLSTVIEDRELIFRVGDQSIRLNNFIAESGLYTYETNNKKEAFYLCSFLNSSIVDREIQVFRRRNQKAPPNIHKKVFDIVSIPQFNPPKKGHLPLAKLGEICCEKVKKWIEKEKPREIKSIGKLRSLVRDYLKRELAEIDSLVEKILKG